MKGIHYRSKAFLLIGIFLCFFCTNSFASLQKNTSSLLIQAPRQTYHGFVPGMYYQLSLGTGVAKVGKTSNLPLTNVITNRYVADRKERLVIFFGLGLGYQFVSIDPVEMSVGMSVYRNIWGHYGGLVRPAFNLNPNFDTLDYTYHVSSTLAWVEQYWLFGRGHWKPYFFWALGGSWNCTYDYEEIPTDPNGSASPMTIPFGSHTLFSFSYGLGVGLNYVLSNNKTQMRIGYRYIYLGKGQLGLTSLQTTTQRLSTGRLDAHIIVFSLFLR